MVGPLSTAQRLAALRETGLDAASDLAFENFAELVRRLLGVPVALVSLVDEDRQFFPGAAGLDQPWDAARQTPLSHSFCQYVVSSGKELVVEDATDHPVLCDNLAIRDLGVIAYAGMPLTDTDGLVLGSLCAIDTEARDWTDADLEVLRDLADACSAELRLRISAARTLAALRQAERVSAQLSLVARVGKAVASTLDADEALRRLAQLLVPALGDWSAVYRLDRPDLVRRVAVAPHRPARDAVGNLPRLRRAGGGLSRVLAGRTPYVVAPPGASPVSTDPLSVAHAEVVRDLGGGHLLLVGLRVRDHVLGALVLGRHSGPFEPDERELVLDVAGRTALAVDNAGLYQVQRRTAAVLQGMLLTELPAPAGLRLAARYVPATVGADVGGDWYDAFALSEHSTMLTIGDVSGHDLRAAGEMGQLRGMLRTLAYDRGEPPAALLTRLDRAVTGLSTGTLATAVLARIDRDPATGRVTAQWSNAGHPPPVLLHADERSRLLDDPAAHGLMLGVRDTARRGESTVELRPGDTLLLFTDGLVESRRLALDHGLLRLRQRAARHATASPEELCDALVGDARATDDVAVLAVRVTP